MRAIRTAVLSLLALVASGLVGPRPAAAQYTITTLASFNSATGISPNPGLVRDAQGNLFGTAARGGGPSFAGTVWELAAGSFTITALASFNGSTDGFGPIGSLVRDAQGNLFGVTEQAIPGAGTIWELAAGRSTITVLARLGSPTITGPTLDAQGNLFGASYYGNTVYELAAGSSTITTLASFNGANGSFPRGSLVLDPQGNLFGVTAGGGTFGQGTIFELAAGSHSITTLASFNGANGSGPSSGLVRDAQGNFFGTTTNGGAFGLGTVYELAAGSSTITALTSLPTQSAGDLILDAQGNLFGSSGGMVFELAAGSHSITTLASFNGANGSQPFVDFLDAQGNIFGTTFLGGATNNGTVFELSPVPEPASLVLLGLGLVGLAARSLWARARRDGGRSD